jgi:hypothetical protein
VGGSTSETTQAKTPKALSEKQTKSKRTRTGGVAQLVESLPSMHKTCQKKKKKSGHKISSFK